MCRSLYLILLLFCSWDFVLFCFVFYLFCCCFVCLLFLLFVLVDLLFVCLLLFFVFFFVLHCAFREIWVHLPGYSTAAARAALPIPASVCNVFVCPNNGTTAVFGIFNVRTDVDACDFSRKLYGHRKRVSAESWLWEKHLLPHRRLEPA